MLIFSETNQHDDWYRCENRKLTLFEKGIVNFTLPKFVWHYIDHKAAVEATSYSDWLYRLFRGVRPDWWDAAEDVTSYTALCVHACRSDSQDFVEAEFCPANDNRATDEIYLETFVRCHSLHEVERILQELGIVDLLETTITEMGRGMQIADRARWLIHKSLESCPSDYLHGLCPDMLSQWQELHTAWAETAPMTSARAGAKEIDKLDHFFSASQQLAEINVRVDRIARKFDRKAAALKCFFPDEPPPALN